MSVLDVVMVDNAGHQVAEWLPHTQSTDVLRAMIAEDVRTAECFAELSTRRARVHAAMRVIRGPNRRPASSTLTPEEPMIRLTIPPVFARDRQERDLSNGIGRWTSRGFVTCLTTEELAELRSDAEHYGGTECGLDQAPSGVIASAKATLRAIAALST